ncbi:unnamed protein product [Orchesella dallaii]|uniref:NET domain-containing protein n=1 Tax=Orchesella dallaii TaxID=48710 RepID=A0ABP1QRQ5_9HEXA
MYTSKKSGSGKRMTSPSSVCSSARSSSSSSNVSSDSDSTDCQLNTLELQLRVVRIEIKIIKLKGKKRKLERKLAKSVKGDKTKSQDGREEEPKSKSSSSPSYLKGKRARAAEERLLVRQMIEKLTTYDFNMLMGILRSTDEFDFDSMEPEEFEFIKNYVKSKLARGRMASSTSPTGAFPSSRERFSPMTKDLAHAPMTIETVAWKAPGSEVPFYDSEDDLLLNTY